MGAFALIDLDLNIEAMAMIAKPAIENDVARSRQGVHRLFDRDGLLKNKGSIHSFRTKAATRAADNDQWYRVLEFRALQVAQQATTALQVTIDDQGVDF